MRKTVIFLMPIILASCSADFISEPEYQTKEVCNDYSLTLVKESDAIDFANKVVSSLDDATRTSERKIGSIEKINSSAAKTRSEETSLGWYLINYENNEGFAVIAADNRISPILAYSETGNLSMSDTIENKGLAGFFQNITNVYRQLDAAAANNSNSTRDGIITDPGNPIVTVADSYGPFLSYHVQNWHQLSPYNQFVQNPALPHLNIKTGCLPLASVMIMSYHEWPLTYKNQTYDWNAIKYGNAPTQVARLIADISTWENYNVSYDLDNISTCSFGLVPNTFGNVGYTEVSPIQNNVNNAMAHLRWYGPMLINVVRPETANPLAGYTGEHAAVIDGYVLFRISGVGTTYEPGQTPQVVYQTTYHVVWGYGGNGNGYYNWSVSGTLTPGSLGNYDFGNDIQYTATNLSYYTIFSH